MLCCDDHDVRYCSHDGMTMVVVMRSTDIHCSVWAGHLRHSRRSWLWFYYSDTKPSSVALSYPVIPTHCIPIIVHHCMMLSHVPHEYYVSYTVHCWMIPDHVTHELSVSYPVLSCTIPSHVTHELCVSNTVSCCACHCHVSHEHYACSVHHVPIMISSAMMCPYQITEHHLT